MTSGIKVSHISIHILICSILRLQYEICVLQATNASEGLAVRLWVGPLSNMIQLSPLSGWPQRSTGEVTMQVDSVHQAANFAWVSACAVIVESFKHLLRVTAYPQFLVLELWAPMGTCSGHYGNYQELLNRAQSNLSLAMYRKCCFTAYHCQFWIEHSTTATPCWILSPVCASIASIHQFTYHTIEPPTSCMQLVMPTIIVQVTYECIEFLR